MSEIDEMLTLFEKNTAKMLDMIAGLAEDQINWKLPSVENEEHWSIRQIIAHNEEVNYFWFPQFQEALINPSTKLGRANEGNKIRQMAVDKADERELSEMVENIKKSLPIIRNALGNITNEQLKLVFPMKDVEAKMPIGFLINHVYPEHVDSHMKQIEHTLFDYAQYH